MTKKAKSGLTILPNTTKKDWERIRFNWGYWDARADWRNSTPRLLSYFGPQDMRIVSHDFDPFYYWGYKSGAEGYESPSETSTLAWDAWKVSGTEE